MINKRGDWKLVFIFVVAALVISLASFLIYSGSITGAAIAGITAGPVGNQSYLNCTVSAGSSCSGNSTKILGLYNFTNSHVELANETGFNYSLCCRATIGGVNLNTTNTNDTYSFNFLDLYQTNNSHVEIPNGSFFYHNETYYTNVSYASKYNVSAFISADNGFLTCNYYENLFGNCTYENETCLLTLPTETYGGNTTNLHVSSCDSSVAYNTSVCCSLTPAEFDVYIDGVLTNNLTRVGVPFNMTIDAKMLSTIKIKECSSLFYSTIIQTNAANVSNCIIGTTKTDSNGLVSLTVIPSGANAVTDPFIGNHTIEIEVVATGQTKTMNLIYRQFNATVGPSKQLPSKQQVSATNDENLRIFERVQKSVIYGYGDTFQITIFDNGSFTGSTNLKKARLAVFNFTVRNSTTNNPISNAQIFIIENNSIASWVFIQTTGSNISNQAIGNVSTDSNGQAIVTVIPTGGVGPADSILGNYSFYIEAYINSSKIFSQSFYVNRTLTDASGPTTTIPGSNEIGANNDQILRIFERVQGFSSGG